MDFFPAFINLKYQQCLVVGGGEVAMRKAELLLKTGALVTVIAPKIIPGIKSLQGSLNVKQRIFQFDDINNVKLVIVATNNRQLNADISRLCIEKNIPVNVVDNPALCSFIVPSIIDRDPIVVAVGSNGNAPVLARLIRSKLEQMLPGTISQLGMLAKKYRQKVKDQLNSLTQRRRFWEQVFEGKVADYFYSGKQQQGENLFLEQLHHAQTEIPREGEVVLLGAGPGDPELLTIKALKWLQRADVIVYDRLISKDILDLARRDAHKIYVGKKSSKHTLPQEEINQLLVEQAAEGKRVVRLKGGDPFIFGRGGEEIATLMENGIKFQVVPGITSASGCSSYCGIPLTHRDYAQSVVFATGHLKDNSVDLNWNALAQSNQTLVIYMGMGGLKIICDQLIEHGLEKNMPVAVIQNATLPDQKIVTGDLSSIQQKVNQHELKPPSLIIVGKVVQLHQQLSWYGEKASAINSIKAV